MTPRWATNAIRNWRDESTSYHKRSNRIFDTGRVFFTKDSPQDVDRQIKAPKEIQKISVIGLDDVSGEFDIETGRILEAPDPDSQYIV